MRVLLVLVFVIFGIGLPGCMSMSYHPLAMQRSTFIAEYDSIRRMVIEEATRNGFTLTTETRPSEYNGWKARFYFTAKTRDGEDQLFVDFWMDGEKVVTNMRGVGLRADPRAAIKGINARLQSCAPAACS